MELFYLQNFLFLFIFLVFLYIYIFFLGPKPKSTTTGFKSYPLLGVLPELIRNRHRVLDWATENLQHYPTNTAITFTLGNASVFTANPLNVEHILKTKFENYPKGTRFIAILEDFLGRGIFNSDGHLWKVQRKTASYEFNTKSLRNFIVDNVTIEIQTRLAPILDKAAKTNQVLDMQDILERFAFDNICKVSFNVDPGCLEGDGTTGSEFMQAFEDATSTSAMRFFEGHRFIYKMKRLFNMGSEPTLKKSIKIVHEFADNIIRSRMEGKAEKKGEDLLSRFMGDNKNSPEFLRDIIISFILAGRDTTSSALTWFFWLLSSRPKVEQKILQELDTIRLRNGKNIGDTYSFEELHDMHYLHGALSESLRLYPPVPSNMKYSLADDVMPDGTFVKKGWLVTYHTYAMGRMENIWGKDCCEFRPERWLENGICKQESPFRFPVFHAGPRICLGKDMAFIQMKSIAAAVIERFKIEAEDKDKRPDYTISLTLRMKDGLRVTVKERGVDVIN